jgi:N-acetylglutamate synthase-like GNAT family acetyltransferase
LIRGCDEHDFEMIWRVINDGARAYAGVIPPDCWTEPYMPLHELRAEIDDGVEFWAYEEDGEIKGVMGMQPLGQVTLIRHAYVLTRNQRSGIGGRLLAHLRTLAQGPVLIGTWADAAWAIRFYQKHGFCLVTPDRKDQLLRRYWKVSARQMETSVVLADACWNPREAGR